MSSDEVGAGDQRGEAGAELDRRPAQPQPEQDRGEDRGDPRQGVVEHRHLDEEALDPLGMANRQLERDVGAERGAADDRPLQAEVVEQREDLLGEQRHRVEPQVVGLVGAAVAEQVDADHPVAALGKRRAEPVEHVPVHQQAVDEDDRRRSALAVPIRVLEPARIRCPV